MSVYRYLWPVLMIAYILQVFMVVILNLMDSILQTSFNIIAAWEIIRWQKSIYLNILIFFKQHPRTICIFY